MTSGVVSVWTSRQRRMLHQPIDEQGPDTTDECEQQPPIGSDVQCGVPAPNGGVVHKIGARDDRYRAHDPKQGIPDRPQTALKKWRRFHGAGASIGKSRPNARCSNERCGAWTTAAWSSKETTQGIGEWRIRMSDDLRFRAAGHANLHPVPYSESGRLSPVATGPLRHPLPKSLVRTKCNGTVAFRYWSCPRGLVELATRPGGASVLSNA